MTKDYLAVLDACVLVPAGLRDTLLRLAETPRLYVPKWSDEIFKEVVRTLKNKLGKTDDQVNRLESELRQAFPEAWVAGCAGFESVLSNDPKDRHVAAAALKSGAQTIVTFNLRHFPADSLAPFDIEAVHPDEFLVNQFHLDDALVVKKFTEQAAAIGRTVEHQLRLFHQQRSLPLFTQTLTGALGIKLFE
jgi:predicted nucleic acid-binding protein